MRSTAHALLAKIRRYDPFDRQSDSRIPVVVSAHGYAYIEGSRTPVYDEREPAPETYTLHWEFDAWLIADQPVHSLTPLQALQPVSWDEAPERLNEFLKRSASPA